MISKIIVILCTFILINNVISGQTNINEFIQKVSKTRPVNIKDFKDVDEILINSLKILSNEKVKNDKLISELILFYQYIISKSKDDEYLLYFYSYYLKNKKYVNQMIKKTLKPTEQKDFFESLKAYDRLYREGNG